MHKNSFDIWLSPPMATTEAYAQLKAALDSGWLAPDGPGNRIFEERIANYVGAASAFSTVSGTAALHTALVTIGIRRSDIVLVPAFSFAATVNPIRYCGAHPYFIDSEPTTWGMDPNILEDTLKKLLAKNRRPKAVLYVQPYGQIGLYNELAQICKRYDLWLIEDAAAALGSSFEGKMAGSMGDFSILSFNGNKIITTSQGGMLLSNQGDLVEKARNICKQAKKPGPEFEYTSVGFNYTLSNVLAHLGAAQMNQLPEILSRKKSIFLYYRQCFSDSKIATLESPKHHEWNRWLTNIAVPAKSKNAVINGLLQQRIECRSVWKPLPLCEPYKNFQRSDFQVANQIYTQWISLPSGIHLRPDQIEQIVHIIQSIV